jgi:hypothetical protein
MAAQAPFAIPEGYATKLSDLEDMQFRQWVKKNNVPFNPDAQGATDYDMRGYWRGAEQGNPQARPTEVNQNDGQPHYTDYYKTPLHQSFSAGSQWAGQGAPQWVNDRQLSSPGGRILFDETNRQPTLADLLVR